MRYPTVSRRRPLTTIIGVALLLGLAACERSGQPPAFGKRDREDPWTAHIQRIDVALAAKNVSAADQARRDALRAALRSRGWEGMLDVGDASLRIGEAAGSRQAAAPRARRAYLAALLRARDQGSLDGVFRVTERFASLGNKEMVEQCLRIVEGLASAGGDSQAKDRVRALRALSAIRLSGGEVASGVWPF